MMILSQRDREYLRFPDSLTLIPAIVCTVEKKCPCFASLKRLCRNSQEFVAILGYLAVSSYLLVVNNQNSINT